MSNRIVTRYASLLLAAFVIGGCQEDEPTGIDTLPFEVTPFAVGVLEGANTQLTLTGIAASEVTWESSNTAIATVTSTGRVTGVGAGVTAITARSNADNTLLSSASITVIAVPVLANGVARTGQGLAAGGAAFYRVNLPAGQSVLTISTSGGTGDADLHVRFGALPTLALFDCRPYATGNNETCTFTAPAAGTYFVLLDPYRTYAGLSIVANWAP